MRRRRKRVFLRHMLVIVFNSIFILPEGSWKVKK